mgnify:FL=1
MTIHLFILLCLLWVSSLHSQIKWVEDDNMRFEMDKRAHMGVSFGLYFFSYTLLNDSLLRENILPMNNHVEMNSLLMGMSIGLSYELYQGMRFNKHGGFSNQDMLYNVMGCAVGWGIHRTFFIIRDYLFI